ncbi:hypothetical protein V8C44DRAFT_336214 [Trichoderma aethiopicum]
MQTEKTDIVVHSVNNAAATRTYDFMSQVPTQWEDQPPIHKPLMACALTLALNIVAVQLNNDTEVHIRGSSIVSKTLDYFPLSMEYTSWCGTSLLLVAILTCLHWSCLFSLFNNQSRWKTQFLPRIIMATLLTLLPLAAYTRDPTTVFVRLLPAVADTYVLAALLIDSVSRRRLAAESAC